MENIGAVTLQQTQQDRPIALENRPEELFTLLYYYIVSRFLI
jgi:hypothetical protein